MDRQTTCDGKTALCTIVHRAVKIRRCMRREQASIDMAVPYWQAYIRGVDRRPGRGTMLSAPVYLYLPRSQAVRRREFVSSCCVVLRLLLLSSSTLESRRLPTDFQYTGAEPTTDRRYVLLGLFSASLSISIASGALILRACRLAHLSVLSLCVVSGKCIVAKWLIGSGCRLGW